MSMSRRKANLCISKTQNNMSEDANKSEQRQISMALASMQTDRTLELNLKQLDISISDLGKTVLDLGSGRTERFARQAAKHGIKVFSLNPQLADHETSKRRQELISQDVWITDPDQKRTAAGISQNLPYANEAFDTVISAWAIPFNLHKADYPASFKEIHRVLKPGGKAFIGPVPFTQLSDVKRSLKEASINFKTKPAPAIVGSHNLTIFKGS